MTNTEPRRSPDTDSCEITREPDSITVQDYFEDERWTGTALWLATAWGPKRVNYIRGHEHSDPWVVTGRDLDQQSFAVHYGVLLYLSRDDAHE